jgi:hypothetical protein
MSENFLKEFECVVFVNHFKDICYKAMKSSFDINIAVKIGQILTGKCQRHLCKAHSLESINQSIKIVIFKRSNYSALGILKRCYLRRLLQIDGPSGVTCRSGGI